MRIDLTAGIYPLRKYSHLLAQFFDDFEKKVLADEDASRKLGRDKQKALADTLKRLKTRLQR